MNDSFSSLFHGCAAVLLGCVLTVLLGACSDDPTAQNAIVPPVALPGATVKDTTIYALRDSSIVSHLAMNGGSNLVGSGGGYSATSILRFSVGAYRDTISIVSATLRLYLTEHQGPLGQNLSFTAYKILRQWDASTVTWDSIQTGFNDATLRGTFNGTISRDSQFIELTLDPALVLKWINTPDAADLDRYGIVLVPTPSSGIVSGFADFYSDSTEFYPTLTVVAQNTAGTVIDTTVYNTGYDTFAGDATITADRSTLVLQAGVPYRGWLNFDVSFLKQGSIVNRADLQLDRLPNPPFNTTLRDSSVSARLVLASDLTSYEASEYTLSPKSGSTTTYSGDARHFVQTWVRGGNYGILLSTESTVETSTFDQLRFSTTHAAMPALRPRLHIVYSVVNLEKHP